MMQPSDFLLSQLVHEPIVQIHPLFGGRNSALYRIQTDSQIFVLKIYPKLQQEVVNRFQVESQCLNFFKQAQVNCVPLLYGLVDSAEEQAILIEYISGHKPCVNPAYFEAVFSFLSQLKKLGHQKEARQFSLAASPYLCLSHLYDEILQRLKRFYPLFRDEPQLAAFFEQHFFPQWEKLVYHLEVLSPLEKHFFHTPLSVEKRVLIPGDFGVHNTLFVPEKNQFYFFDFEYFGWDDPIRLVGDFLYHPAMSLNSTERQPFLHWAKTCYAAEDPDFEQRLILALPFFVIRWTLIVLNEFLPERRKNRGGLSHEDNWEQLKQTQLHKAEGLIEELFNLI